MGHGPGTVSKILWHFTGGPVWDDSQKKQSKRKKTRSNAFKAICGIVESKRLRCSNYTEIINGVVSQKFINRTSSSKSTSFVTHEAQIPTSKVCCVADIPIQHLKYHSMRYGEFAIGFHRESILKAGFNPVLYSLDNSSLTKAIFRISEALSTDLHGELMERLRTHLFSFPDLYDQRDSVFQLFDACMGGLIWDAYEIAGIHFQSLATFVKTFKAEEFQSIYCEREWRSSADFSFSHDDIAMIILPKGGSVDYHDRFISIFSGSIPRRVPIVAWEDLVEH